MSQDTRLYGGAEVWDQALQVGQRNLVQAIRDFWPSGITSVLDVGCGDGKLTSRLNAPGAPTIVGLDSSAEALSRLPFESVLADAQTLPFPAGAFDLVMSTDTLEHMPDAEEANAWDELFRVAGKVVLVAVPFREELLDATAKCADCGQTYHVNWHQRRYDIATLHQRAPAGWRVRATVLAGEPWSAMLPPETLLRRTALGEWAGWELALCPHCGSSGQAAAPEQPLQSLLAQALAKQLYPALAERRHCRSHSEILLVFQREDVTVELPAPPLAQAEAQPASRIDFTRQPSAADLRPFCQVAQRVAGADGRWRLQFPLYDGTPTLDVRRQPGSQGALHLMLEDSIGSLLDGCVLEDGEDHRVIELPRPPLAGYYGVLASCATDQPFAALQLGDSPAVLWTDVDADGVACSYLLLNGDSTPLFVQVAQPLWFDPQTLTPPPASVEPSPAQVLVGLQACFEGALRSGSGDLLSEAQAAETNQLRVQIQNLSAERDVLQRRVVEVDRLAVQLQNLTAERDAFHKRAIEADRLAVTVQNLSAERDALRQRALEADQLAVQSQNLTAERDALLQRAIEADRLAVAVQNLSAERDALLQRVVAVDQLAIQLQNLDAEHAALVEQAKTHAETLHQQDQHSSEAQAQLQEALSLLAQQEAHNQHLHEQLRNNQARLAQLNQHMETRVGTVVRNTLASLVNKK